MLLLAPNGVVLAANAEFERTLEIAPPLGDSLFTALAGMPRIEEAGSIYREGMARGGLSHSFVSEIASRATERPTILRVHLRSLPEADAATATFEPIPGDAELQDTIHRLETRLDQVRTVKHEISNPLMGLLGTAELLREYPDLSDESRRKVDTILSESRRIKEQLALLRRLR